MKQINLIQKYLLNNIGIFTYILFVYFCFICLYILSQSRPDTLVRAISDFGFYDETKWIFVFMCTFTSIGSLIFYKQILKFLSLENNILLNIIGFSICLSFIGLSITPYNEFFFFHAGFASILFGGFGIFLFYISYIKKFQGIYIKLSAIIGIIELLFLLFGFAYLAKISGGWGLPTIFLLLLIGLWTVISEYYLNQKN